MIIDETIEQNRKATISTSNTDSIGTFRIKESAKAFAILSSSLYQNPIRSIIRELGCNARDAHVAAGNPEPWTLTLPSELAPEFAVSDRGTGLSHEEVMQIYTTYFESTKTNSNDFVGALGLGSKSPFSYTDNFTVTSVKDGIKNIYSTFLTEEQIPSIVLLDSSKTSDPNGVEVRFSVKKDDFGKFKTEAVGALRFFEQKPIGCPEDKFSVIEFINDIEHLRTLGGHYNRDDCRPLLIMGGVAYTFDTNIREFEKFSDVMRALSHLLIRAEIGDVDIQPSREGLTMTKKTIDFISRKLVEATNKINADIAKKIAVAKTEWEKIVIRDELSATGTFYENRFLKNIRQTYFSIPAKYSGRIVPCVTHRTTVGSTRAFNGIERQTVSSDVIFVINDAKVALRDLHECFRKRINLPSRYYTIIEFTVVPGVSVDEMQKDIATHTLGKVPELSSVVCEKAKMKNTIKGIVYQLSYDDSYLKVKLRRSSQENFKPGSFFVEINQENNIVDEQGVIVKDFAEKYRVYEENGGNSPVFAIKHNSKFDRALYKRFIPAMDEFNIGKISQLKSERFFSNTTSVTYNIRTAFIHGVHNKLAPNLIDPVARVIKKYNPYGVSTTTIQRYENLYPGTTKHLTEEIDQFHKEMDLFVKRYGNILLAMQVKGIDADELIEFANWCYETKYANI